VPYLKEIMDCVSNPRIREVVVMKAAQIGYTQGVILNGIGYYMMQDPSPMLVVQPAEGDAEKFSKEKLAPMLRDTPIAARQGCRLEVARQSEHDPLEGSSGRHHRHGRRDVAAWPSRTHRARHLLRRGRRLPAVRWAPRATRSSLAKKRTLTFSRRKILYGSTPTIKGISKIERLFEASDQRYLFVPCPHCDHMQRSDLGREGLRPRDQVGAREARRRRTTSARRTAAASSIASRWP
jgi:phage terminase large subunit GpA-like protein